MQSFRATPSVQRFYPDAIRAEDFVKAFLWYTRLTLGLSEEQIAFLSSVCSDDINAIELPHTRMVGPFILGGLDGYPFVGKTGLKAFAHHIPENGAALMFVGPHVGVTEAGEAGKVVRPGHSHPTACCGAGEGGLRKLEAGTITYKKPCDFAVDDYQQETIEQILLKHQSEILCVTDPSQRFIKMSELIYSEAMGTFQDLLRATEFDLPIFVFGGILINEDGGKHSSISFRHVSKVVRGKIDDLTDEFKKHSNEKFRELESGNAEAFSLQ